MWEIIHDYITVIDTVTWFKLWNPLSSQNCSWIWYITGSLMLFRAQQVTNVVCYLSSGHWLRDDWVYLFTLWENKISCCQHYKLKFFVQGKSLACTLQQNYFFLWKRGDKVIWLHGAPSGPYLDHGVSCGLDPDHGASGHGSCVGSISQGIHAKTA